MIYPRSLRVYKSTPYEVIDNPRLTLRKGDIVQIPDSPRFPEYSRNQFAVVINRLRQIRSLRIKRFYNYKTEVMMLTGSRKGHIRSYGPSNGSLNLCKFI